MHLRCFNFFPYTSLTPGPFLMKLPYKSSGIVPSTSLSEIQYDNSSWLDQPFATFEEAM